MAEGVKISQLTQFAGKQLSDVVPFSGASPFNTYSYTIKELLNLDMSGLTGGGLNNLDGWVTVNEAVGQLWNVVLSGTLLSPYQLQQSTAAADVPRVVHPLDFNAGNNPKIFQLVGFKGTQLVLAGINGNGYAELPLQASSPATPSAALRLFANASDNLSWIQPDGFSRTFASTLTGNRTYTLPDLSGVIALVPTTVPSIAGTAGNVLVNGATGAVQGTAVTLSLPNSLTSINALTSQAGTALTLGTGTSGTALTFASATNIATFAAAISVTGAIALTSTINFPTGVRQTFAPNGTVAGLNVGSVSGAPSSLINGDIFYDTATSALRARVAGITIVLASGAGTTQWGQITGTLSNQTDLQAALDAKQNAFGNPGGNGYFLSASTVGVFTWVPFTGTNNVVLDTSPTINSPTLVTPALGVATATSVNGLTLTSSTGTFTLTNLKVFTVSNTLTLAGTDSSTLNIGNGGTLGSAAYTNTSAYAASGAISSSGLTMSTANLLGRTTAGTGVIEQISVGTGLSLSAGSLTATGVTSGTAGQLAYYASTGTTVSGVAELTWTSGSGTLGVTVASNANIVVKQTGSGHANITMERADTGQETQIVWQRTNDSGHAWLMGTPNSANVTGGDTLCLTYYTSSGNVYTFGLKMDSSGNITMPGLVKAGSSPTTLTDSAGKILSAALNTVASAQGGTGFSTYTTGDLIYASATNTLSKRAAGTDTFVLTMSGGVPTWAAATGGGVAPGGSNTDIQFNNSGSFGGASNSSSYLRWVGGTVTLMVEFATNTVGSGLVLLNDFTAASGSQFISPALVLSGQGWKTTATAASQQVDWRVYNKPIQGTTNPDSTLNFERQINGGGYASRLIADNYGAFAFGSPQAGLVDSGNPYRILIVAAATTDQPALAIYQTSASAYKYGAYMYIASTTSDYIFVSRNNNVDTEFMRCTNTGAQTKFAVATDATSATNGSVVLAGGLSVTKSIFAQNDASEYLKWDTTTLTVLRQLALNTAGDGMILINDFSAIHSAQYFSPSIRFSGKGWNGSVAKQVDWRIYNRPVETNATNPVSCLNWEYQIASGGYTGLMTLDGSGVLQVGSPAGSITNGGGYAVIVTAPNRTTSPSLGLFQQTTSLGNNSYGAYFYLAGSTVSDLILSIRNNLSDTDMLKVLNTSGQIQSLLTTDATTTATGAMIFSGGVGIAKTLWPAKLSTTQVSETPVSVSPSANVVTVDLSAGTCFPVNLNANVTSFTISNAIASRVNSFSLVFTQDSFGGRTVAWTFTGKTLKWSAGTAPTITSTANAIDIISFVSYDGGSTYYGFVGGQAFS